MQPRIHDMDSDNTEHIQKTATVTSMAK